MRQPMKRLVPVLVVAAFAGFLSLATSVTAQGQSPSYRMADGGMEQSHMKADGGMGKRHTMTPHANTGRVHADGGSATPLQEGSPR